MILPALSIRQPWSWLILTSGKNIENRSWNTKLRGTFLIHASKGMTRAEYEDVEDSCNCMLPPFESLERGGIVGAARIETVWEPTSNSQNPWHYADAFGFELADVVSLPFRPYKGALGFFRVELTPAEADALRAAKLAA